MQLDPLSFQTPSNDPNQRRLPARFYFDSVEDKLKSAAEGRPIFRDVLMINIMRPADPTTDVIRPAKQKDIDNYPQEYALFKQHGELATSGTPLEQLTFLTRSQIAEFKAMKIHNVESLAQLDDRQSFMGWRDLKNKAVAYLAYAKDQAVVTKWEEEKAAMHAHTKTLEGQIDALRGQVAQLIEKMGDSALVGATDPKRGKKDAA